MKTKEHGIGIFIKKSHKSLFIELHMVGKLTHNDYMLFLPILKKALKEAKKLDINMLVDLRQFRGWELRAAWDDMMFGFKYKNVFNKIAVIGSKKYEEIAINMFVPLMKGKLKLFHNNKKALKWLYDK